MELLDQIPAPVLFGAIIFLIAVLIAIGCRTGGERRDARRYKTRAAAAQNHRNKQNELAAEKAGELARLQARNEYSSWNL